MTRVRRFIFLRRRVYCEPRRFIIFFDITLLRHDDYRCAPAHYAAPMPPPPPRYMPFSFFVFH